MRVTVAVPDYETLLIEQLDRVVRVTLNRPEKRNAISPTLQTELVDAVERSADDPSCNAVVIRGAGRSFCAGYDLGGTGSERQQRDGASTEAGNGGTDEGYAAVAPSIPRRAVGMVSMSRQWDRIWNAPIPVIAQIHGHCLAGGTDLAQHCDLIVVADDATIGFPALRMGGTPPTNMWLYNMGPQWAKRLLFTGDSFTGRLAAEIGFALCSFAPEELDEEVMVLARRIALMGRDILAINKLVINLGLDLMGRANLQNVAAPMDTVANQAPELAAFNARVGEVGLAAAFKERDAPFSDVGPLDIDG